MRLYTGVLILLLTLVANAATIFECDWEQGNVLNTGSTYTWDEIVGNSNNELTYNGDGNGWNSTTHALMCSTGGTSQSFVYSVITATDTLGVRLAFKDEGSLSNGQENIIGQILGTSSGVMAGIYIVRIEGDLRLILSTETNRDTTTAVLSNNTTYQIEALFCRNSTVSMKLWNELGTILLDSIGLTSADENVIYINVGDRMGYWNSQKYYVSKYKADDAGWVGPLQVGSGCTPVTGSNPSAQIDTVGNSNKLGFTFSGTIDSLRKIGTWPVGRELNGTKDSVQGVFTAKFTSTPCSVQVYSCGSETSSDTIIWTQTVAGVIPAYANAPFTFVRNSAITTQNITSMVSIDSVTCGTLPTGLELNKTTGAVTGTPTTVQAPTDVKFITWNNDYKVDSANISFEITAERVWTYTGTAFNVDIAHTGIAVCSTKVSEVNRIYLYRSVLYDSIVAPAQGQLDTLNKPNTEYRIRAVVEE